MSSLRPERSEPHEATSPKNIPDLIGERLIAAGRVTGEDVAKALAYQNEQRDQRESGAANPAANPVATTATNRLGAILVRMGALSEESLLPHLADQTGLALANTVPEAENINAALSRFGLTRQWWQSREAVPYIADAAHETVAILAKDPLDRELNEMIRARLAHLGSTRLSTTGAAGQSGQHITLLWAKSQDLERAMRVVKDGTASRMNSGRAGDANYLRELAEEAPVIEFVNNVLALAVDERASDIHIEPAEREFEVRLRVDGVLTTRMSRAREGFDAVASRVKLISGLDIAERRLPQDGRITTRVSGVEMDIRVSAIPGVHGESLVLRLLPKERADLSLASLGMAPDILRAFTQLLKQPNGIILVTGPTGSGKSTTLYSALSAINDRSLKIVTVEDPVEYRMSGITQIQTHSEIGYTFARALRSILRHDPDVIMVGEIRDAETAEIAIQAALTGHLVLATIHTNDAPSAFTRLLEMGIEPFLLATSVRAVLAQRLIRKLNTPNAAPVAVLQGVAEEFQLLRAHYPNAMPTRDNVLAPKPGVADADAYRGRAGIHELLTVTPDVQEAIVARASATELANIGRRAAGEFRYRSLREDGMIKAAHGVTSVEEVLRVAGTQSQGTGAEDAVMAAQFAETALRR
jgi:general secretion pathway protein E